MIFFSKYKDCASALGVESGAIPDEDMEASTTRVPGVTDPSEGRLNNPFSAWAPKSNEFYPYLDIDLGSVKHITGISTQGHPLAEEYVRHYRVKYSNDRERYNPVTDKQGFIKVTT